MKNFIAMCIGLVCTLLAINAWAGTFAPPIPPSKRLIMDDTFYDQNTQLDHVLASIRRDKGIRIVGIGDSTMYGAIVHANQTIPYYLQQTLQAKDKNQTIHVYNLAFPGARPADLYAMLKRVKAAKPDLIFIDVNIVFFSDKVLHEAALANKMFKREFLFAHDVPNGIFTENRLEEIVTTLVKDTNIGQYKKEINEKLFGKAPRLYVQDWAHAVQTGEPVKTANPQTTASAQQNPLIGKSWRQRVWDAKEQQVMARIYAQGPIPGANDSVMMLRDMIRYARANHLNTVFYLTPQNETLIGKFFSLPQLHQNEDYLIHIMQQEGAWMVDLRHAVPADDFGDYDHMLSAGNRLIAQHLADVISRKGGISR
ncbi:hypothetical protein LSG31_21865 [Fodinisporobacter ferrooxydans]|uniref:SGNH/GDSL hydrolase family protein n=1 Tax=Fodinisporobacter ferrooxydans TaxID=2901836 RepID=A0ABY4CKF0_9BACL|nr:hypothetical protein LSG31_21865 [Alicyclobacillaceae bacterium MYW30-H2]